MSTAGDRITQLLDEFRHSRDVLVTELNKVVIGQREVIEQILAAIFTRGHVLLVGVPGLAYNIFIGAIILGMMALHSGLERRHRAGT